MNDAESHDFEPPSWPAPEEWIRGALTRLDAATISERVERYRFLSQHFDLTSGLLIVGGVPAWFALKDAQGAFLAGNFMAVVFCAQVFAEHSLASWYILSGDDKTAESGFAQLIDRAHADGTIDRDFADRLHELRQIRNPYTHPRALDRPRNWMTRAIQSGHSNPYDLAEADARFAVEVMAGFIDRRGSSSTAG